MVEGNKQVTLNHGFMLIDIRPQGVTSILRGAITSIVFLQGIPEALSLGYVINLL